MRNKISVMHRPDRVPMGSLERGELGRVVGGGLGTYGGDIIMRTYSGATDLASGDTWSFDEDDPGPSLVVERLERVTIERGS